MMYISDAEVAVIKLIRHPYSLQIATFNDFQNLELLRAFSGHVSWNKLAYLAECVSNSHGCGFEVLNSRYEEEFDLGEEQWIGVQISNDFGDDPIVLSVQAYESFCLKLLDFAETVAKAENNPILAEPIWSKIIADRECLRVRVETGDFQE